MPKILHMTDLHIDDFPENLSEMAEQIKGMDVDVFLIGGDNGGDQGITGIVRLLKKTYPEAAIAWVMGNHDLWGNPVDHLWRDDRHSHVDACYLERGNLELKICTVVGTYGHYDYSGGDPTIPHEIYEQYRFDDLGWNDHHIIRGHRTNPEIARDLANRFALRYRRALIRGLPIVVLMHTLPFVELNAWERNFYGAYGTNGLIGNEILTHDTKPIALFCGHTHNPICVDTFGFPMINTGSDYNRVRITTFHFPAETGPQHGT
uniref:Calcineurin-like phosphoesterase n=1 Tax=Candidatus Kentrum sp. MB TaxID=2138164 RepID=A0A450WZP3_9GAMM|nr:MAG: Calcineurin-like phosphoesterase [Candidatus Kentron sp. MB]VFK28804.1 MAG: Calcineurin-like phosphoesterase [Candidatus Kentron sp. MB]VFK74104.1 MAG: Calcineurin-like phosphoesterase [Candidatus Kentron sp. MB]